MEVLPMFFAYGVSNGPGNASLGVEGGTPQDLLSKETGAETNGSVEGGDCYESCMPRINAILAVQVHLLRFLKT